MELKGYQARDLESFCRWHDVLLTEKEKAESNIRQIDSLEQDLPPDVRSGILNYPKTAWSNLAQTGGVAGAGIHIDRVDAADRPIPHVCFKVPTGGGKTLLAAAALERLNRNSGLSLWITPTTAIYQQTKGALWNREHPYRQMLEKASGGRLKLLEKADLFTASDVEHYLCVMLIMLPALNRHREKDFLRMFRDSGRYPTFFPDDDDSLANDRLRDAYPGLHPKKGNGPIRRSLANVFKMLRPVIILDEAHKAYGKAEEESKKFVQSVNELNPSLVIELSATPNPRISNLLVDITGVELKNEQMIKLPVQIKSYTNSDWHHTLGQARDEMERLSQEAQSLENSEGRHIRPIALVRVDRTGRDQRTGDQVHAEDVREYLVRDLGVPANCVAVKSAEMDELKGIDLFSRYSTVQWIITKSALMEGWDCSFAYVLVMLDNTRAQRAITQLVGRVMRQPDARRTGREALDQCYVYCCNTDVGTAVDRVKNGLEAEGLTGLGLDVVGAGELKQLVFVRRREQFRDREIFLPQVLHRDGKGWCELHYQSHILPVINWRSIAPPNTQDSLVDAANLHLARVDIGEQPEYETREVYIDKTLRISWYARRLGDVVPNTWQAARIVVDLMTQLRADGFDEGAIYDQRQSLANQLRNHVVEEVERMAEQVFRDKLAAGEIRFDLNADVPSHRISKEPYEIMVPKRDHALERRSGEPVQISLFEPVMENSHFDSELERNFACYLDKQKAIQWWHRVAVRQDDYYIRGWKPERIWPDFIAMGLDDDHLMVFETKGEHMRDTPDTRYKEDVFEALQDAFNLGAMTVPQGPVKGTFQLIFNTAEFPQALASPSCAL